MKKLSLLTIKKNIYKVTLSFNVIFNYKIIENTINRTLKPFKRLK